MKTLKTAVVSVLVLLALTTGLGACGGGSDTGAPAAMSSEAQRLQNFEVYAIASAEGNELQADVYGLTLNPLRAFRLTTDKRVSWLSADENTVVVAAADEQIDKLGYLLEGGSIGPLADLGRLVAYSPEIQSDGTIRYQDDGAGDASINRYMAYDPEAGRTRVLYRTTKDLNVVAAMPGGKFLEVIHRDSAVDQVAVVSLQGGRRIFPVADRIASPIAGKTLVAVAAFTAADVNLPADATVILDPRTGRVRTVEGWAPLTWTPDGTKLLVVRAGETRRPDAELAVLDPGSPDRPEILGTIPGLTFFQADWVPRD